MVYHRLGLAKRFDTGDLAATRIFGRLLGWRGEQPERGFHLGFTHRQRISATEAEYHQFQDETADRLQSFFCSRRFFLTSASSAHITS